MAQMTSQNRWPVYTSGTHVDLVSLPRVTGRVRRGVTQAILGYVVQQFHFRVEPVRKDWSWGYAYRPIRGSVSGYSNHASATAVDLNAPEHPLGARNTFSSSQVREIRKILGECEGLVRWGGDYAVRGDEMHFEINTYPTNPKLAIVAAKLLAIMGSSSSVAIPAPSNPTPSGALNMSESQFEILDKKISTVMANTAAAFGPLGGRQHIQEQARSTASATLNHPIIRATGNVSFIQEQANQTKLLTELKSQMAAQGKIIEQLASSSGKPVDMAEVAQAATDAAKNAVEGMESRVSEQLEQHEMNIRMALTEGLSEVPTADPDIFVEAVLARFHELTAPSDK